ncbi:olfactory receptor 13F1-like [Spea bombifrons]|uniref:olfactory receptor 13F1-like n=1 Tax=Spea bombifrons TaxID=233779 RepID=UPI002349F659|nr:olfactory receptor 13F1-like [Spea bombifrons]
METNGTFHKEFYILAFSKYVRSQFVIFFLVLFMYLFCVFGNLLVVTLIYTASQLHTPMYIFLGNLSVQDIVYVSAILPQLLAIIVTGDTSIAFLRCIFQMFLFVSCVITEFLLLTSMAYDRYVAICNPLHYAIIMNKKTCTLLAAASWLIGIFSSLKYSLLVSNMSFCSSQEINHFFCDMKAMLKLSCSNTTDVHLSILVEGVLFGIIPFILIITSYAYIISAIQKICSSAGRYKAFSSCSSHIIIVVMFCGTSLTLNLKQDSQEFQEQDKLLSMLYILLVPVLNPLVYSIRNNDILKAIKTACWKVK